MRLEVLRNDLNRPAAQGGRAAAEQHDDPLPVDDRGGDLACGSSIARLQTYVPAPLRRSSAPRRSMHDDGRPAAGRDALGKVARMLAAPVSRPARSVGPCCIPFLRVAAQLRRRRYSRRQLAPLPAPATRVPASRRCRTCWRRRGRRCLRERCRVDAGRVLRPDLALALVPILLLRALLLGRVEDRLLSHDMP